MTSSVAKGGVMREKATISKGSLALILVGVVFALPVIGEAASVHGGTQGIMAIISVVFLGCGGFLGILTDPT